jgi:hypothetical protein
MFDQLGSLASLGPVGQVLGYESDKHNNRRTQRYVRQNMRLGNQLDMDNQKAMFDYRIDQGLEHGMTPYEMFMGPAAGAGGGTSGSGAVLGNAAAQSGMQRSQLAQQRMLQGQQILGNLAVTKMQTEAQKEIAGMQVGATERGQDIQKMIADNQLVLDWNSYHIALSRLSIDQAKAPHEIDKLINEVSTSKPKFIKYMKYLTMGADNMLATMLLGDKSLEDIANDPEARKQFVSLALAYQSQALKEGKGIEILGEDAYKGVRDNQYIKGFRQWLIDLGFDITEFFKENTPRNESKPPESLITPKPSVLGNSGSAPNFGVNNPFMSP